MIINVNRAVYYEDLIYKIFHYILAISREYKSYFDVNSLLFQSISNLTIGTRTLDYFNNLIVFCGLRATHLEPFTSLAEAILQQCYYFPIGLRLIICNLRSGTRLKS